MGLLVIDQDKCKKDGICASECPMAIIQIQDESGFPDMVQGGEAFCIVCGHCVAVCPHGALNHLQIPVEGCPPIRKALQITEEQAVQFLRSRRSIRFYEDRPVEQQKIRRLIEVARYAPTGFNTQLVKWLVFTDKEKIRKLSALTVDWLRHAIKKYPESTASYLPLLVNAWEAGYDGVLRNAPAVVVAIAPKEARNGMVDVSLALSYFELTALTLGLGTCWAGLLQSGLLHWPPLKQAVGLTEDFPHHYPMMLGYPKFAYHRLPERKPPQILWNNDFEAQ